MFAALTNKYITVKIVIIGLAPVQVTCVAGTTIKSLLEKHRYNTDDYAARPVGSHNYISNNSILNVDTDIVLTRVKGIEDIVRNNLVYIKPPREYKKDKIKQCSGCGAYPMVTYSDCIYCGNSLLV